MWTDRDKQVRHLRYWVCVAHIMLHAQLQLQLLWGSMENKINCSIKCLFLPTSQFICIHIHTFCCVWYEWTKAAWALNFSTYHLSQHNTTLCIKRSTTYQALGGSWLLFRKVKDNKKFPLPMLLMSCHYYHNTHAMLGQLYMMIAWKIGPPNSYTYM